MSCPIALYPASTSADKTHFHQINTRTGHRLRQQMVDAETGRAVDKEHRGRGYELSKGRYVEIDEDELKAVRLESTHPIEIDDFVPAEDTDQRYLDKPYYVVPNGKTGADAFVVIRDAMKRKDKIALARVVLTNREHIIALRPLGKGLLGTTLRYPYELRDEKPVFGNIPNPHVSKDMIDLAAHICRLVQNAAVESGLPVDFFARVIWQESRFDTTAYSRAGAQGIAQFMPATASSRGLLNPFDPISALRESASYLQELKRTFGNLGLAAAAYNVGPGRLTRWSHAARSKRRHVPQRHSPKLFSTSAAR